MPATTAQNAIAAIGIDIGKNSFHIADPCSMPGSNLDKAREVFTAAIKHRPRIRLTMRQRTTCFEQRPVAAS